MNRLSANSTSATISTTATLPSDSSTSLPESTRLPPVYAISLQVNDFFMERVERTLSLKSLSPHKVVVFFKLGDAMIGCSYKELRGINKTMRDRELNSFYAHANDCLLQDLQKETLTHDTVLTAHILFLQRMESGNAFFAQVATCSSRNYSRVTTSTAQNLPAPQLHAFIKAHYTAGIDSDKENALLLFLFPIQIIEPKGMKLVKKLQLPEVIDL